MGYPIQYDGVWDDISRNFMNYVDCVDFLQIRRSLSPYFFWGALDMSAQLDESASEGCGHRTFASGMSDVGMLSAWNMEAPWKFHGIFMEMV